MHTLKSSPSAPVNPLRMQGIHEYAAASWDVFTLGIFLGSKGCAPSCGAGGACPRGDRHLDGFSECRGANKHAAAYCDVLTFAYSLGAKAVLPDVELGMPELEVEEEVLAVTEGLSSAAAPTTNSVMSRPVVRQTPMKFRRAARKPVDCLLPSPSCTLSVVFSGQSSAEVLKQVCCKPSCLVFQQSAEESDLGVLCKRPSWSATST